MQQSDDGFDNRRNAGEEQAQEHPIVNCSNEGSCKHRSPESKGENSELQVPEELSIDLHDYLDKLERTGLSDWAELLDVLEHSAERIDTIYFDIDETLITTEVYEGSQQWFDQETVYFDKTGWRRNIPKAHIELNSLRVGHIQLVYPDIVERLAQLERRNPELKIVLVTSRPEWLAEQTRTLLAQLGLGRYEAHFGNFKSKKLSCIHKLQAPLPDGKVSIFIDDDVAGLATKLVERAQKVGVRIIENNKRAVFTLPGSLKRFEQSVVQGNHEQASTHFVDVMLLARYGDGAHSRAKIYLSDSVQQFLINASDKARVSYLESVTDFFYREMDGKLDQQMQEQLLYSYYEQVTDAPQLWVAAHQEGRLRYEMGKRNLAYLRDRCNYELLITAENSYLFLEPLLKYLKVQEPDLLILPDSSTRPFTEVLEDFVAKEQLSTKIVNFPVSAKHARDSAYELFRWMRLVNKDLPVVSKADQKIVDSLLESGFADLPRGGRAVIFDDSMIHGKTARLVKSVLARYFDIETERVFVCFDYQKQKGARDFPVTATFKTYGEYEFRDISEGRAPAVIARTIWEGDSSYTGFESRRQYRYPPLTRKSAGKGRELVGQFQQDYERWFEEEHSGAKISAVAPLASKDILLPPYSGKLPRKISGESSPLTLVRAIDIVPHWLESELALNARDKRLLEMPNTLLYRVFNEAGSEVGCILLSEVENIVGEPSLVVEKIQPRMRYDQECKATDYVGILSEFLQTQSDISRVYMQADPNLAAPISDSHAIRRQLSKGLFKDLPVTEDVYHLGNVDRYDGRLGGDINLLWKAHTEQDLQRAVKADELLAKIQAINSFGYSFVLQEFESDLQRIAHQRGQIPVSERDLVCLEVMKSCLEAPSSHYSFADNKAKALARVRIRGRIEILVQERTGEKPDLSGLCASCRYGVKRSERVDTIVRYFLMDVYDGSRDLGAEPFSKIRDQFNGYGIGFVLDEFSGGTSMKSGSKGAFLKKLSPDKHQLVGGRYKAIPEAQLDSDDFERFLRGEWFAAPIGLSYTIDGSEAIPSHWDVPEDFFQKRAGHTVIFAEIETYGESSIVGKEVPGRLTRGIFYLTEGRVYYRARRPRQNDVAEPTITGETKGNKAIRPFDVKMAVLTYSRDVIGENYTAKILDLLVECLVRHSALESDPEKAQVEVIEFVDELSLLKSISEIKLRLANKVWE